MVLGENELMIRCMREELPAGEKQEKKDTLRAYYKVWSAFTKFIQGQCARNVLVHVEELGSFFRKKNAAGNYEHCFCPSSTLLDGFKFIEDGNNFSSIALAAKDGGEELGTPWRGEITLSYGSIGDVCLLERDRVKKMLASLITKMHELSKAGYEIRLDLKVGELILFPSSIIHFT